MHPHVQVAVRKLVEDGIRIDARGLPRTQTQIGDYTGNISDLTEFTTWMHILPGGQQTLVEQGLELRVRFVGCVRMFVKNEGTEPPLVCCLYFVCAFVLCAVHSPWESVAVNTERRSCRKGTAASEAGRVAAVWEWRGGGGKGRLQNKKEECHGPWLDIPHGLGAPGWG